MLGGMNIKALLSGLGLAFALVAFPGWLRADGFIIVSGPVEVPVGHFAFAPLEVSYHRVTAKIAGQVCTTTVEEEFFNPNPQMLEGTYLFPVPKTAQIDKFTMVIDGKEASAELLAADKARSIYEEIVRRKRDPALLEYADRNVFKVRIFPIEPHSRKQVKIVYTEILKSDSGLMSYLYPLNTEKFSAAPVKDVSVTVDLTCDRPLTSIYSPSHDVTIKRDGTNHATVQYRAQNVRPDTDFQLYFAPQKREVSLDLLTYRPEGEDGYFLLLAAPGTLTAEKHLPKDVTFVLDTSGSMADGNKLVQAKKALQFCIANLNADDRFEIIRFSSEAEPFFGKLTEAKEDAVAKAQKFVASLKPDGGTAIYEALQKAAALRPEKNERPYVVIFMTDGLPTVGEQREDPIVELAQKAGNAGTRIFCFGMGNDVNAKLLDRIVDGTHAVSDYVLPTEDIEIKVSNFFAKIREPVLSNVKLSFPDGVRITKLYPQAMPDLFKGEQLVLCGRYSGAVSGDCVLEGDANGKHQSFKLPVSFSKETGGEAFVGRLWASRRVAYLLDEIHVHGESTEVKNEVTTLARQYGLVTPYTAYLIMEDEKTRNVTMDNQVMRDLSKDTDAKKQADAVFKGFKSEDYGEAAVAAGRAQNHMRSADQPADALAESNKETARALSVPATAFAASPSNTPQQLSKNVNERLMQYTQQTRYLAGRAFYQNGNQWIDSNVSTQNAVKNIRLKFGSPEYFEFMSKHPEARPYLSLGQNVKLALSDAVYDIYDDGAATITN